LRRGLPRRLRPPVIGKAVEGKPSARCLHPARQFSANPQMVSRFVAEARAVNQIRHKNIIDIFAFGALPDGRQYYVMELLEGSTLDKLLEESKGASRSRRPCRSCAASRARSTRPTRRASSTAT
jgi:serine/threonine protein kinase